LPTKVRAVLQHTIYSGQVAKAPAPPGDIVTASIPKPPRRKAKAEDQNAFLKLCDGIGAAVDDFFGYKK
jgi:hypothetical protein